MAEPSRYLTRLRLENFQSHRDTDLHFAPGINLVTGSSDSGKSASLRALHFLMHNQPRSKSFIRRGTDECRVTAYFSDGVIVQRIKGAGAGRGSSDTNAYVVSSPTGGMRRYERFGTEIPEEVQKALGSPPCDERHGPVAYAAQLAPYFLVTLTSGELPRALSELTGIQDYEEAAQHLGREAFAAEKAMKAAQERMEGHEARLREFDGLEEEEYTLRHIEGKSRTLQAKAQRLQEGRRLLSDLEEINAEGLRAAQAGKLAGVIAGFGARLEPLIVQQERLEEARSLIAEAVECESQITIAEKARDRAQQIAQQASALAALETTEARLRERRQLLSEYASLSEEIEAEEAAIQQSDRNILAIQKEQDAAIASMRRAGFWCDACDRPLIPSEGDHDHGA